MTAPANQTAHVPAGSPAGGQFAVGSHVPPKGGHAAKAPLGPLTTNLAYNAKQNVGSGYNVKGGDPHVHALQQKLKALGYTDNSGKALQVDGKYGPLTTQAIQAVQKAVGLKPDGIVTPQLYARIMASPTTAPKGGAKPHVVAKPHVAKHHRGSSTLHPEATERLHEYWVHGKGAAKIAWGAPGDFDRCVAELGKYIGDPQGYCNLAHHAATGMWPAQHAAMEKGHRTVSIDLATVRAEMSTQDINDLPDSDFAYIEPGGSKDSSGKTVPRSKRHFPIHDAAHVRDALSRAPQSPFGEKAMPKIRAAAKKFGIDAADDSGRSDFGPSPYVRSFPLEDISIRAGGDGRTVDAYATVFDTPVPIHDQDGDYIEVIDRRAFDRILQKVAPSGSRSSWRVGVFYNHGMTLHGTPSDMNSMPIGVPLEIKADGHGLFTRTRYSKGPEVDRILEAIKDGSLSAYSFSGRFDRSDPLVPRGGFRSDRNGNLRTVRRTESTLREYGPTPFPAYQQAEIVGVRAERISEQLDRITELLRSGAPLDSPLPSGAPEWDSPPEDSPIPRRSGRSVKEEMMAARSAFLQRYGSR